MTQTEIAAQIGVSQMHISRLLVRALTQLRTSMHAEPSRLVNRARHPTTAQARAA